MIGARTCAGILQPTQKKALIKRKKKKHPSKAKQQLKTDRSKQPQGSSQVAKLTCFRLVVAFNFGLKIRYLLTKIPVGTEP